MDDLAGHHGNGHARLFPLGIGGDRVTDEAGERDGRAGDEAKDGVYTNYTYGFRFKYPEDKFELEYPNVSSPDSRSWSYLDTTTMLQFKYDQTNTWNDYYRDLETATIGGRVTRKHWVSTKINQKVLGDTKLITVYETTLPEAETEYSTSYSAIWYVRNEGKYIITLISPGLEQLSSQYKTIFDQMVDSVEFINQ